MLYEIFDSFKLNMNYQATFLYIYGERSIIMGADTGQGNESMKNNYIIIKV